MEGSSLLSLQFCSLRSHLLNLTCWQSALWRGPRAYDILTVETPRETFFAAARHSLDATKQGWSLCLRFLSEWS